MFIGIGGGSGSGKTTIVNELLKAIPSINKSKRLNLKAVKISMDNYYKSNSHLPLSKRSKLNFSLPEMIDFNLLRAHIKSLLAGKSIDMPIYSFRTHTRTKKTKKVIPADIIILDGMFALYDKYLNSRMNYRIFVTTDPRIAILRRIKRDLVERGRTISSIITQCTNYVIPMYDKYVYPTHKNADFLISWEGDTAKSLKGLKAIIIDHFK